MDLKWSSFSLFTLFGNLIFSAAEKFSGSVETLKMFSSNLPTTVQFKISLQNNLIVFLILKVKHCNETKHV